MQNLGFRIVAIDPNDSRRNKMKALYAAIHPSGRGHGEFVVASVDEGRETVKGWTNGIGTTAVLEVSAA
jgi:hypothetical protein